MQTLCNSRAGKNELEACKDTKQTELEELVDETFYYSPPKTEFDYESFWNHPDDE